MVKSMNLITFVYDERRTLSFLYTMLTLTFGTLDVKKLTFLFLKIIVIEGSN